jgi:peroxiredoxin
MYKFAAFFFLVSFISQLCAQNVVISGKAIDYAGKEITFYFYPDPVVHQRQSLGSMKVAGDGSFTITIPVTQPLEIYTDIEKYTGTLIIEQGKSYKIVLPPFSGRTVDEAQSPYFKPELYWLGLPDTPTNDPNLLVRSFLTEYNLETVKNQIALYQNFSKSAAKNIISKLELKFNDDKNEYFRILRTYTFAELEYTVSQRDPIPVIEKYFARKSPELNNPAYQHCFGTIFSDYLHKESKDYKNNKMTGFINTGNFSALVSLFEGRGYNKEFSELVVLKGLYDGYYTGGFDKKNILMTLNKSKQSITSGPLKPVLDRILISLESLSIGSKAPSFKLRNNVNQTVSNEKYLGKFLYLIFFRSSGNDSRNELDSIVPVEKKLRQVLSVVSIETDNNFDSALKLWKDKNYPWELLNGSGNKSLIENYKAEVVPAFYLIAPDGTLILSPAPPPTHEFETLFLKIFRDYNFRQDSRRIKSQ